jgi:hypothetical protein
MMKIVLTMAGGRHRSTHDVLAALSSTAPDRLEPK